MRRLQRLGLMIWALSLCASCGPKPEEIGYTVLMAGPACWLMMSTAVLILRAIGGLGAPASYVQRLPLFLGLLATTAVGLLGYVMSAKVSFDFLRAVVVVAGSSSVSLGLLSYAWLERRSAQQALERFSWPVIILYLWLPALCLILYGPTDMIKAMEPTTVQLQLISFFWWWLPGVYGVLPLILLVGLGWRARRRLVHERAYAADEVGEVMS